MTPSRLRRLRADYENTVNTIGSHPFIRLIETEGTPPEKYTVEYYIEGLAPGESNDHHRCTLHRAEIFLPNDYPRRAPFCRMITPVFHPNIDAQKICIGDHWSAGQSLAQLIVRIAEMICYQSYNVKSPLNAEAAAWAEQNLSRLPLQKGDLSAGM